MLVKKMMKTAIVIEKDISLNRASKIISDKNINSLVFVKGKKIIGIVTKEDLIKNFGKKEMVSKIMTKKIISVSPEDSIKEAKKLMKENRINVLPVVEKNELVGIVAGKDLLGKVMKEADFLFE